MLFDVLTFEQPRSPKGRGGDTAVDRYNSRLSLPFNERHNPCGTLTKASGTCPKPKRLPSSLSARIIRLNDARKQSFLLLLVYSTLPQPNTTTNPKLHLSGAPTLTCCTMRTSVPTARRPPACDALEMRVSKNASNFLSLRRFTRQNT